MVSIWTANISTKIFAFCLMYLFHITSTILSYLVYLFNDAASSADYTLTNSRMLNGRWLARDSDLLQNGSRNPAEESEEDHGRPSVSIDCVSAMTQTAYTNLRPNFYMLLCVVMRSNGSLRLENTKGERDNWTSKLSRNKEWRKLHNVELHNFCASRVRSL